MDNIINLFSDTSSYQKNFQFTAILLFIIILSIFSKIWGASIQGIFVILAVIFALYSVDTYIRVNNDTLGDFNKTTMIKLKTLQTKINSHIQDKITMAGLSGISLSKSDQIAIFNKNNLDSLYIDSTIINFLYSILPLYEYNPEEFYLLLKGTNNILKIRKQIEDFYIANTHSTPDPIKPQLPSFKDHREIKQDPIYTENIHEMFEIAIQLRTNCLNNIHNIIYNVPKTNKMYSYIDKVIERYAVLMDHNLKIINEYHIRSIKEQGINTRTKFLHYKGTKGYDRLSNQNIIPTKSLDARNEIHQFFV
jgi:hypothetical protein